MEFPDPCALLVVLLLHVVPGLRMLVEVVRGPFVPLEVHGRRNVPDVGLPVDAEDRFLTVSSSLRSHRSGVHVWSGCL